MTSEDKQVLLSWQAPEFEYHTKTPDWYWAIGLIVLSASIASFIRGNFFFGAFILIAGILLFIYGIKKPRIVMFEITDDGVTK